MNQFCYSPSHRPSIQSAFILNSYVSLSDGITFETATYRTANISFIVAYSSDRKSTNHEFTA